ncbi:phosphate signaling complex protein PhoU [Treponema phagedenis]|uniref:Phosphate-specific transport system accessory protein PhoU n=1 Tax=Treponema phagedenis TaxID=162 RepID=A0A0B7GW48_TREPH|nr:phosphate signaling complex protein PhoU [Treponema phagedenis]NVP22862.1 phosphate signaling complex protein PhoU [Treponema phagedenis]QEJ94937.1 phosphate signaling complex protein PhoU [Treponema phagedenis]QEJ98335.1 phosphate signaling complex protein PhoU [Treponema phagedenis]QEK00838.1 phosphate signaling complex protein PhoU [Treponema phagedenis]QEK03845.1 phosphate signaling complex protein PhoU [Treponema phagedenis]
MTANIYKQEYTAILHEIERMGITVIENLENALQAFQTLDTKLADSVIAKDDEIDKLQIEINDTTIKFMATRQPVAQNLRELVSIFKICTSLERIGDYTVHIAKEAKRLAENNCPHSLVELEAIILDGIQMLKDALNAFLKDDVEAAYKIAKRDDEIDRRYKLFLKNIILLMTTDSARSDMYSRLLSTSNSVERLCDHIVDICEAIVYICEGIYVDLN